MLQEIKQQLWKLSLGMPSFYGPDGDIYIISKQHNFWKKHKKNTALITPDILFGVSKTRSYKQTMKKHDYIKEVLEKHFKVFNEQDLNLRMKELLQGSKKRRAFNARRQMIALMPHKERSLLLNSLRKDSVEYLQYCIVIQYDKTLPPAGILALDLANYTSLCRLGAYLGYLEQDKIFDYLQESAILAQKNYSGFQEYGLSSTVGALFSYGYDEYQKFAGRLYSALTHPNSYWNHIEWDINLEGVLEE